MAARQTKSKQKQLNLRLAKEKQCKPTTRELQIAQSVLKFLIEPFNTDMSTEDIYYFAEGLPRLQRADIGTFDLKEVVQIMNIAHQNFTAWQNLNIETRKKTDQDLQESVICFPIEEGCGVLLPSGCILTCYHIMQFVELDFLGSLVVCKSFRGDLFVSKCIALSPQLNGSDLALLVPLGITLNCAPVRLASFSATEPAFPIPVTMVGNPCAMGVREHEDVGVLYEDNTPWRLLKGKITKLTPDKVAKETNDLGDVQHTVETYQGDSGGPLYSKDGCLIALHNTYCSTTHTRHAVSIIKIIEFLHGCTAKPGGCKLCGDYF